MTQPERRRPGRPSTGGHAAPTDAEMLRLGLDLFAELGYDGASVRELAKRLGVSHNLINDRYGSKARFWRAVVDSALPDDDRDLAAVFAGHDDDLAKLRALVTEFYRTSVRHPQFNRLLADEFARDTERLDYLFERFLEPVLSAVAPIVERLVAAGRVPAIPLHLLYFAVVGPVAGVTQTPLARRLGRVEHSGENHDTADALAALVLDGLLNSGGAV